LEFQTTLCDIQQQRGEVLAISKVSMELKSMKMILGFLEIDLGRLTRVYVDNIGAIHLAKKASSGLQTKHIDSDPRLHFVRELTQGEGKILDIEYVRSEEIRVTLLLFEV
jgi:hypothetical protein